MDEEQEGQISMFEDELEESILGNMMDSTDDDVEREEDGET